MRNERLNNADFGRLLLSARSKITISLLVATVFLSQFAFAAGHKLEGNVKDSQGNSIPGVTIMKKGTTIGVISDFNGNFTVEVEARDVLLFSFVGMATQEILVGNKTLLEVVMQVDELGLEEVVVVGYGSMKKSDLTGSVARANLEAFADQPNTSIMQSLQGTVSGLNVGTTTGAGSSPSISIRGRNSLSGSTDPLIVLDGVIYRGSIIDINPADITSVDVLKDASSKAIYGSQAANGVLMITTKNGKEVQKPTFNFSSYYTFSSPSNQLHPLDSEGYIEKMNGMYWDEAYTGDDYQIINPDFDPSTYWNDQSILDGYADGTDTDWVDLVTQNPYIYNVNMSMSGRTDKTSYFISGGYTDEAAWVKNDDYNKVTLRANFESKVTNWLTFGMQTFMSSSDYSGQAANLRNAMVFSPLIKPYNEDGTLNLWPQGNDINPLSSLDVDNEDKRMNLFGNFSAKVDVPKVKGLSYRFNYSVNYRSNRSATFNPYGNNESGSASKYNGTTTDRTADNVVNYVRTFNDLHSVNATLLYGYEGREGESTNASSADFINPALGYNAIEEGNIDQHRVNSGAWDEYSLYQMGRLNYKYSDRYIATFTVRRDGFSGFGTNNKFGIFPSAALAWNVTNENFMQDRFDALSHLKIRASYGRSGNRTVGRYATLAKSSGSYQYVFGDGGSAEYGQSISSMANNDLGWETTTGTNLGVDFGVYEGRISGSVDYYESTTEDILYNIRIPNLTGFSSIATNIGQVGNHGLEITLNTVNVRTSDFEWKTTLNFSRNRNKVKSILGRDDDGDGKEDDIISSNLFIGEPIGTIYNYNVQGIYQIGDEIPDGFEPGLYKLENLNPEQLDADGIPIEGTDNTITAGEDRKILGYTDPSYRIGVYNEFTYKSLTFSAFVNSVQGGKDMYRANQDYEYGWKYHTMHTFNTVEEFDYWTPQNPNATYSTVKRGNPVEPGIYKNRSFIRLQDVKLAYALPKSILERWSIDNMRVFISGKNLCTWTNWDGLDPEAGIGLYPGSSPVMKSYSCGLNLTF